MPSSLSQKLIEVALPLEAINAANFCKESIRHGQPNTLHLWWARRLPGGAFRPTGGRPQRVHARRKIG
jgi:hypothetical protein